jgi:hypothetical protein
MNYRCVDGRTGTFSTSPAWVKSVLKSTHICNEVLSMIACHYEENIFFLLFFSL